MKKLLLLPFLLFTIFVNAQFTAIPDPNFEQALIDLGHDTGSIDGQVLTASISGLTSLDVRNSNISNLTGIQDFNSLTNLVVQGNQLTNLNVTQNTALTYLDCRSNLLSSLDVTQNTALTTLDLYNNNLANINVTQNINLITLDLYNNNLTTLDITQNTALKHINCMYNELTTLDVTHNTELLLIDCSSNNLTNLDLSQNIVLSSLTCDGNQLTTLDVTQNPVLTDLVCFNNQLTTLNFMQNSIRTLFCSYNLLTSLDIALEPSTQSFLQCGSNSLTCLRVSNITENSCLALNTINNPDLNCITIDANSLSSFPSSCLITNIDSWTSIDTTSCNDGCTLVGINDIQESIPANIHPNPTTEQVTISLEEAKTGILIIRNSLGQIVLQETFTNTNQLDVSLNEPDGIYFLQIETDGQVITRKIIKQ